MSADARPPWRRWLGTLMPQSGHAWPVVRRQRDTLRVALTTPPPPDRIALQWLLASGLLSTAPLAFDLALWVSASFVVCVAWRYAIERFHVYRPGTPVRYALAALVTLVVYREFDTLFGLDPGAALLVALLGLKLLELRSLRDAMVTLFLFYVVLGAGFLFDQTLPIGLWAIACVTVSIAALARLQQRLPARAALRLAGALLLKAVPLLLILYVLFPRLDATLWRLPTDARRGLSGMSEEMSPGSINGVAQSGEIALRVDFLGAAIPPPAQLYWRGLVFWDTDGRNWRRGAAPRAPVTARPLGAPSRYRITLEPTHQRWLYALDLPASEPEGARVGADFTLVRNEPVRERLSYEVTSFTRYRLGPLAAAERNAGLALPPISARVRAFADELRARDPEPEAIVRAVLTHFREEQFVYTLAPPLLGGDPVDQFLFQTRRGFCEHYAAAFVTLMRAAGVPARVVVGYQGGELNPAGNYLIVRQADAHAWAEVALPERGWVRVDPTAAVAPERIEIGSEAIRRLEAQGLLPGSVSAELLARALDVSWFVRALRQTQLYWDYSNIAWYRFVVDYRRDRQEGLLQALGFERIEWSRILITLGGSCTLILLAYVVWSRRAPPLDPVQRLYRRFCRKLARAGVERAPHEGPLDYAARAAALRPDLAPRIDAVTARYLSLRYSAQASNDDLRRLTRDVADLRTR